MNNHPAFLGCTWAGDNECCLFLDASDRLAEDRPSSVSDRLLVSIRKCYEFLCYCCADLAWNRCTFSLSLSLPPSPSSLSPSLPISVNPLHAPHLSLSLPDIAPLSSLYLFLLCLFFLFLSLQFFFSLYFVACVFCFSYMTYMGTWFFKVWQGGQYYYVSM